MSERQCEFCGISPMPPNKRSDARFCQETYRRKGARVKNGHNVVHPADVRFWSRVNKQAALGCWEWTAAKLASGYGSFRANNRAYVAHRYAYERLIGLVPDGLQLDHLCRNRACVNPHHLEPVPQSVNVLRGISLPAINARKTHCSRGHEFTPENTYRRPSSPTYRACRECRASTKRAWDQAVLTGQRADQ